MRQSESLLFPTVLWFISLDLPFFVPALLLPNCMHIVALGTLEGYHVIDIETGARHDVYMYIRFISTVLQNNLLF